MTRLIFLCALILNLFAKEGKEMKYISVQNSALILIEYQNEWINEGTKLSNMMKDKVLFKNSIENSKKVLTHARKLGLNIIHVPLIISDDYKEFGNSAKYGLRAVIPKVKTWQGENKEFNKDFRPLNKEFIVTGRIGASGFAGSNLNEILRNNGIENLFLMGYASNVCVDSTMREAHDKGYNTTIISDAISTFTKAEQEHFLENIVHHFANKTTTENFLSLKVKKNKKDVVKSFYSAIGENDLGKALSYVTNDINYVAVKDSSPTYKELYGVYKGKEELIQFFEHLKSYYKTLEFRIDDIGENDNNIFVKGYLKYEIIKNKEVFETDWMAFIEFDGEKIKKYQFFKDTALLEYKFSKKKN